MKTRMMILGLIVLIGLSNCAVNRVVSTPDCDTFSGNPTQDTIIYNYWWGFKQPKPINPECETGAMSQVEVKTTFGQAILSFITLGTVVPRKVKWCCMPIDPPIDTLTLRSLPLREPKKKN